MSKVRRKGIQSGGYTEAHERHLLTGHDYYGDGFGRLGNEDIKAMRAAWKAIGGKLLAKWVREHPGCRPFAWWALSSPERRRCINGVHPFANPERTKLAEDRERQYPGAIDPYRTSFGVPSIHMLFPDDSDARYESELDYLSRLGLLGEAERAAVEVAE